MHQFTDRPSKDLGSYVYRFEVTPFEEAERDLVQVLHAEGYRADVAVSNDLLRVIEVKGPQQVRKLSLTWGLRPPEKGACPDG